MIRVSQRTDLNHQARRIVPFRRIIVAPLPTPVPSPSLGVIARGHVKYCVAHKAFTEIECKCERKTVFPPAGTELPVARAENRALYLSTEGDSAGSRRALTGRLLQADAPTN